MLVWLFLFGEREEPPGEFPNRTTNRPTECALLSAEVQVILSACFEQIVFRVGNLLILREILPLSELAEMRAGSNINNRLKFECFRCCSRAAKPDIGFLRSIRNLGYPDFVVFVTR